MLASQPAHLARTSTAGDINMPTVIAHHDVEDTDHWLHGSRRNEFFGPLGVSDIHVFVDPQNPQRVGLMAEVPDLDALFAALQTPEAAQLMADDGVIAETLVLLIEHTHDHH
jgi:hypothetical protein